MARSSIEAEQVQLIDTTATVYNFEVEDFHTYFVGKQAVWVHNDAGHFDNINGNSSRWTYIDDADISEVIRIPPDKLPINAKKFANRKFYFKINDNPIYFESIKDACKNSSNIQKCIDDKVKIFERLNDEYPNGIEFKKTGYPDFYSHILEINGIKCEVDIGSLHPTSSADDIRRATIEMRNKISGFKKPDGYTWHHVEFTTKLILVKTDLHSTVRHSGGRATRNLPDDID